MSRHSGRAARRSGSFPAAQPATMPNAHGGPDYCSYLVQLSTTRSLTDREEDALGDSTHLTFCIEH